MRIRHEIDSINFNGYCGHGRDTPSPWRREDVLQVHFAYKSVNSDAFSYIFIIYGVGKSIKVLPESNPKIPARV